MLGENELVKLFPDFKDLVQPSGIDLALDKIYTQESAGEVEKVHPTITYSPNQKSNYLSSQIINTVVITIIANFIISIKNSFSFSLYGLSSVISFTKYVIIASTGKIFNSP